MLTTNRKLRVFLCHASQDKSVVGELCQRLLAEGWIDPWLDEEKLLPGQDWDLEIEKAVEASDAVIVCLSNNSVTKEGYVQKELRNVFDIALEKPEGAIFIIPLRLDDCSIPRRLKNLQYVDYFPDDQQDFVFKRLLKSLDERYTLLKSIRKESFVSLKIFLSSTDLDLENYREIVATVLRKHGHDVRSFGTHDEERREAALSELGKCDVLVGIYAHQYGYVPEENEFSIIEQEYWHAKSKDKPIFCFVVDEDYPWPPKMIESDLGKATKLKEFIKTIKKEKVLEVFTTSESLASQVVAAVGRYISEQLGRDSSSEILQEIIARPRTSLPYLPYFFGRERELKIIADTLLPQTRSWGVLIDGAGGIGKTALAIKAAHEAPDEVFDRKIFITAKSRELTPAGPKTLTEYTRISYLAMLNELAYELGEDSIPKLPEGDRASTLRRALTKQRALIIFDNLENMEDRESLKLYQFLSLIPEGNKALVTSRRRSDVDVKTIRLNRLNPHEVKALIDELAKINPLLRSISDEEKTLLILHTGGNPLLIKWVAGQLGREHSNLKTIKEAISFMQQASRNNDPLEYIFGDLITTLSAPERLVLASLTHLGSATYESIRWISQMADGLPKPTLEYILDELTSRSILNADTKSLVYYLPTVTSKFIRSSIPDDVSLTGHRLANYVFMLAADFDSQRDYKRIKALENDWPAIVAALEFFFNDANEDLQFLCGALGPFLKFSGRWDDWLWLLDHAEKKALKSEDYYSAGMRAFDMALIYSYWGQPAEVFRYAELAKSYWERTRLNQHSREQGLLEYVYGVGYKLENNYELAIKHFKNALLMLMDSKNENSTLAQGLASLAEAQMEYGDLREAQTNLMEALRIAENINNFEDISIYKGSLADLALAQTDWVKAEELARGALELAEQIGQQEELARNNYRLAQSLLQQGFPSQASSYARTSVGIYTKLRHKYLLEAQELLLRCKERISMKKKRA
jgi:tetratricopeptide (TPR) repeat protein